MKILIASSKHFYNKIPEIKTKLENLNHEIMTPNSYEEPFKEEALKKLSKQEHISWKQKMMKSHEPKIKLNDAILVLNFEKNNISNYIGRATFMEIIKAWELNKKVFFYNNLPNCSFTDELNGINPTILNQNLNLIK